MSVSTRSTTGQESAQESAEESAEESAQESAQEWRGVAAENSDEELTRHSTAMLQARSRRLLTDLLRPHRKLLSVLLAVVLVENAARLSIPYLVKEGIDLGIPPIQASGDTSTLYAVVAILFGATAMQAVSRLSFLVMSGRLGQDMLIEVRRRVFRHFQALSPA